MAHAFRFQDELHDVWLSRSRQGYILHWGRQSQEVTLNHTSDAQLQLQLGASSTPVYIALHGDDLHIHLNGEAHTLQYVHPLERLASTNEDQAGSSAIAPMPGSVIEVQVEAGQTVKRGDTLMIIESMKMETTITATIDGVVNELHVQKGDTFDRDAVLATIEPSETGE